MSIPAGLSTYVTFNSTAIVGVNNGVTGRVVPSVNSTGTPVIGLYDGNTKLGFEFLPNPTLGGVFRYRYGGNTDQVATILTLTAGKIRVVYDQVITKFIGIGDPAALASGVTIYAAPTTGEGNIALNTGAGLTKLYHYVDPVTQDGAIQFYYGNVVPLTRGTFIDPHNIYSEKIITSTITVASSLTICSAQDLSTTGSLTVDLSGGRVLLLFNGEQLQGGGGGGGTSGSTFSSIFVSTAIITTTSTSAFFTSTINGIFVKEPQNLRYLITGETSQNNGRIFNATKAEDLRTYRPVSTNGAYRTLGYEFETDYEIGRTVAVGRDNFNRCSTIQYTNDGGLNWSYINGGNPFINTAQSILHAHDKWVIGGIHSSITGSPIIWSSDGMAYVSSAVFPAGIKRDQGVNDLQFGLSTFVAAMPAPFLDSGRRSLLWSKDLNTWNSALAGGFTNAAKAIGFSVEDRLFVAGGRGDDPGSNNIATSRGGKTWTMSSIEYIDTINTVGYYGGLWVAGGLQGSGGPTSTIVISYDGFNWIPQKTGYATEVYSIRHFGQNWYATTTVEGYPSTNNGVLVSADGQTWSNLLPSTLFNVGVRDIAFNCKLVYLSTPMTTFHPSTVVRMNTQYVSTAYLSTAIITRLIAPVIYPVQVISYR